MWIVITGAPSSGKTTLLQALQERGYRVVAESAREVLAECRLDESGADVQRMIEQRQMTKEMALPVDQRIILDRGLPDSLAYRQLVGLEVEELRALIQPERYAVVFLCGFGEHTADGVRKDDVERAQRIESLIRDVYKELGCRVVELPWSRDVEMAVGLARRLAVVEEELRVKG
jgi:predicted ATPase